jgi:hypothetical protein
VDGIVSFMMSAEAKEVNDNVFRKANAQDDKGLEEEAKSLLVRNLAVSHLQLLIDLQGGTDVVLEKEYFQAKYLDFNIAPAVLIYENMGDGVIHSRASEGKIDILPTGPKAGNELRILVLKDNRTGLVFRNVLMRRFIARGR